MANTIRCTECNFPVDEQGGTCDRCGSPATPPSEVVEKFLWRDGYGQDWTLEASPESLVMADQDGSHAFNRHKWGEVMSFRQMGGNVVLRIDIGDREIGFMLSAAEMSKFLHALDWIAREDAVPTSKPVTVTARSVDRGPDWPKMTFAPIVSLTSSFFAFLPFVGVFFALVAYIFSWVAFRRSRPNAAYRHVRVMAKIGVVVATIGLGICLLSTHLWRSTSPGAGVSGFGVGEEVRWSVGAGIAAFVMVVIGLSFHEAGHAISAWWCGDDYSRSLGRVTLNPMAHIDLFGTILLPLILMRMGAPVFGYAKPVPVRLGYLRRFRRAHILVALAGPVANLLQAAACLALLTLLGSILALMPGVTVEHFTDFEPIVEISGVAGGKVLGAAALMLKLGFGINVFLACFNLIPIPPLDGSGVVEHLFPRTLGRIYEAIRPVGWLAFLILIYAGGNLLYYLLMPAFWVIWAAIAMISRMTGF